MRRKKLAARILSVFIAAACVLANNGSLIAVAAENTGTDTAQDVLQSENEDSADANEAAEEEAGSEGKSEPSEEIAETEDAVNDDAADNGEAEQGAEDTDVSESEEETEAADVEEESEEETETADLQEKAGENTDSNEAKESEAPEEGSEENTEESEAPAEEEQVLAEEEQLTMEEAAANAEKDEQPEAMEIIDSDGVIEGSSQSRKDAGSWEDSVEAILSVPVINADVDTASSGCVLAGVTGTYIADADTALDRINEIRREACEEGVRNPDTGMPLTPDDYVPIKWSGDLEYIARMRAAESAYTGGHARMNGKQIWSLTSPSGVRSWGEVIAWNNGSSMIAGINQWYGEKADWVNQKQGAVTGHYTEMIDPTNLYVGLGTFCTDSTRYYNTTAGEFSYQTGLDESRMDMAGDCVQMLDMSLENVNSSGEILGRFAGAPGTESEHLLAAPASFKFGNSNVYFMYNVNWSSSDQAVVTVSEGGRTTAAASGTAVITASAANGAVTASAEFTVKSLEDCEIELEQTSYTYDGDPKKPAVTVSYKGTALKEGTDYTLSYEDNVNAGTAKVTITGSEEYAGSIEKTFAIEKAPQTIRAKDLSVNLDDTGKIKVTGAHTAVSFESEDTSVAVVAEDGTVTGVGAGETVITVRAGEDGNYEAAETSIHVTVIEFIPADLTKAQITLQTTQYTYDGKAKKPAVTVTADGNKLSEGYTVTYVNNVNAGKADAKNAPKVMITGDGETVVGSVEIPFTIKKATQSISISASALAMDAGKTAKVTVTGPIGMVKAVFNDTAFAKAAVSDNTAAAGKTPVYTVTVRGIAVGAATMTVTASGDRNHEAAKVSCKIRVRPKATAKFKAAPASGGKGIRLTWTKVAGATNYQIYRNGKLVKTVGDVAAWTDTGANVNGTRYTFKIYAKAAAGVSSQYKAVVYYKLNRPAAPRVTNSASGKATVRWAKNDKAGGYQIQYSLRSNFSGAKSVTVTRNSIVSKVIGSLSKGKVYYVRTRVYKKVGGLTYYSAWSAAAKVGIRK